MADGMESPDAHVRLRNARVQGAISARKSRPLHPASDVGDALCEIQFRAVGNYSAGRKGSHQIRAKHGSSVGGASQERVHHRSPI